jgi:hypothetical protein
VKPNAHPRAAMAGRLHTLGYRFFTNTRLGLRNHVSVIRQAGFQPLLLAGMLFVFLVCGGYLLNGGVMWLFA